jgi:hypothetical protein
VIAIAEKGWTTAFAIVWPRATSTNGGKAENAAWRRLPAIPPRTPVMMISAKTVQASPCTSAFERPRDSFTARCSSTTTGATSDQRTAS